VTFGLPRDGFGFGKLIIDETGIARKRMFGTQRIEWSDVREYWLRIEPANSISGWGVLERILDALDRWTPYGPTPPRHRLELVGEFEKLVIDSSFANVELAIDEAMRRIGPRLLADARRELDRTRVVTFGDFGVRAEALQWQGREPIARDAVEALEIIDNTPLQVFVQQRGKARAYAHIPLQRIPNVLVALELAEQLGYRVRGRERLQL
jgi:hypothetical protein